MRSSCRPHWARAVAELAHPRNQDAARVFRCALLILLAATFVARSAETDQRSIRDAASTVIAIENMRFVPAELTVKRGSRIVWSNKDLVPHTVTSNAFDSHSIQANASWSYVANEPGDYTYVCAFHPTMKARLIVQ